MTIPRTAILLAAVTALALPLRALAACPDSHGQLIGYNNLFPVSTASFDTTYNVPGGPSGDVGFDLAAGTLHMSRTVYYQANWTRVIATDAFDVMGVAPGTPVTLVANLDVTGQLVSPGCGGAMDERAGLPSVTPHDHRPGREPVRERAGERRDHRRRQRFAHDAAHAGDADHERGFHRVGSHRPASDSAT